MAIESSLRSIYLLARILAHKSTNGKRGSFTASFVLDEAWIKVERQRNGRGANTHADENADDDLEHVGEFL